MFKIIFVSLSKYRFLYLAIFLLIIVFLGYISIVKPIIPLSYDEAWNFTDLSRHGPLYAITHYPFPNNHVFFTVLQSILTPTATLSYMPYALRLVNVVVGSVFFCLIYAFFNKTLNKSVRYCIFVLISCFLISPLVTPYFIVGRGYVLGSLLLFIGIYFLSQKKYTYAIIPFALSVWTVPTFLYALPFLYCATLLFDKKQYRSLITFTGIAIIILDFFLYLPILKNIFASTNLWTTYSFFTFFGDTIQSLSNYSFIPYGRIPHYLYIILYIVSLCFICLREKHLNIKRFFVYLNTAIFSYLFVICLLSQFHLARPPFMRNGIFIPMVISVTMIYGITYITIIHYRRIAWCILIGNLLVGLYLFMEKFPYTPANPYPYLLELSPLSKTQQELLREIQEKKITVDQPSDSAVLKYYSVVYNIPLVDYVPSIASKSSDQHAVNQNIEKSTAMPNRPQTTKPNNSPFLLPDNPFYITKRIWQQIMLKSYDTFVLSKKPKIRYLSALSDVTYAESLTMWNKGKKNLALKTITKAEHFITLITPEIHTISNSGDIDKQLYEDIKISVDEHLQILTGLIARSTELEISSLLLVQTTAINNFKTITFLIGQ